MALYVITAEDTQLNEVYDAELAMRVARNWAKKYRKVKVIEYEHVNTYTIENPLICTSTE